jgi:glycosyltransferase involved in cell wall biosynthesis
VRDCITSLRASGVAGLEVVIADDGSTDDTETTARSAEGVVYVRQPNAGPALARNTGFAASHGRYVCFLDSDDSWTAGTPQRLVDQLDAHPDIAAVFADTSMGNPESGFADVVATYGGEAFDRLPAVTRDDGLRVLARDAFFRQQSTRNVMFLGSLLVRREVFAALGGFDPELRGAADWEFAMRLTHDHQVAFSPGASTCIYLKHDEGMSTDVEHMEKEFILALDAVRRKCVLGARDLRHINEQLRRHMFGFAYLAYEAGELQTMRQRLRWAFSLGQGRAREALFLGASYLPRTVLGFVRAMRQALS